MCFLNICFNSQQMNTEKPNLYVVFYLLDDKVNKLKSSTKKGSGDEIKWNALLGSLPLHDDYELQTLRVEVYNSKMLKKDELLGFAGE